MSSEPTTLAGRAILADFMSGADDGGLLNRQQPRGPVSQQIAAIEAEAVAAYRADLEAKVRALPAQPYTLSGLDTTTDSRMVNRAAILRLLTDGAEPPEHPEDADMNTAAGHEHWDER